MNQLFLIFNNKINSTELLQGQYDIVIFVDNINNRINFIFRHIFAIMGLNPILIDNREEFIKIGNTKINYSRDRISDELYIKPHGILYANGIQKQTIKSDYFKGLPVIFSTEESDFPFDIFSAVFYLITRYEEYLDFKPDEHGRYQFHESIASSNKFLETPIVEKWIDVFKDFLKRKFKDIPFSERKFEYIPTIDVDSAFSYKNKGIVLGTGLILKDIFSGNFKNLNKRFKVIFGMADDPFNNFDYLSDILENNKTKPVFFFQTGKRGKYDKNISFRNKAMINLVRNISGFADIGLHPSYESNTDKTILLKEKLKLENALNKAVTKNRQHYLKLNFPNTYNNLLEAGLKEDYSMGYASTPGFRAGTCTPYNFFDIKNDKETGLKIVPFQLMDATFKSYLKKTPEETGKIMLEYYDKVKRVNGTLVIIWHNDSFDTSAEGEKWRFLFQRILDL